MKISQTTLSKIKTYILETQANSTYNSSPHEPLEMCYNPNTAYQWNMCNCYCYLNRYLATEGEKRGNIKDLLKCCHYAWFERVRSMALHFDDFKYCISLVDKFHPFCIEKVKLSASDFINDKCQIKGDFWSHSDYFQLATLLIQQHNEYIDLEST